VAVWLINPQMVTALAALGALVFTSATLGATRDQVTAAQDQVVVAEQGQITKRYTRAVDQLGQDHLQVRLGGIYALERIMRDSPRDQSTVNTEPPTHLGSDPDKPPTSVDGRFRVGTDVQAALSVLGRRDPARDGDTRVDLADTCLVNTNLAGARLDGACLVTAGLEGASLNGASLVEVNLDHTSLQGGQLVEADLDRAWLVGAWLNDTRLTQASLNGTNLAAADLNGADLSGATHDGFTEVSSVSTDERTTGTWW
jgi:Pentapeptide repeats (8 copies)